MSVGQLLGLDEGELDRLAALFMEATAETGAASRNIVARIKSGMPFGRAIGVPDGAIELLYARAHRWGSVGRHNKAEPIFRALCILDGEAADFWTGLGICLRTRSAWSEALAAFETASSQRPDWAVPHLHALELSVCRGDWQRATAELSAFEQKTGELSAPLAAELARYKAAIDLHREKVSTDRAEPDGGATT